MFGRRLIKDVVLMVVLFGLPIVFWQTYSGPYRWFADLQLAVLGRVFTAFNFVLTCGFFLLICMVASYIIGRVSGRPFSMASYFESNQTMVRRFAQAAGASLPLILLAYAGYSELEYQRTPATPSTFTLQAIAAGERAPSRYITITDADGASKLSITFVEAIVKTGRSGRKTTYYVPLLPADYQRGDPVRAFAEIPEGKLGKFEANRAEIATGVVLWESLPGIIRSGFERDKLPPASAYVLIRPSETRADFRSTAIASALVAGLVMALVAVFAVKEYWQARNVRD